MPARKITLAEIAMHFDKAIVDVAGILGVCTTVLKKICREHGIKRWPQRKLQSINKMMASIECAMRNTSDADRERLENELTVLRRRRMEIAPMCPEYVPQDKQRLMHMGGPAPPQYVALPQVRSSNDNTSVNNYPSNGCYVLDREAIAAAISARLPAETYNAAANQIGANFNAAPGVSAHGLPSAIMVNGQPIYLSTTPPPTQNATPPAGPYAAVHNFMQHGAAGMASFQQSLQTTFQQSLQQMRRTAPEAAAPAAALPAPALSSDAFSATYASQMLASLLQQQQQRQQSRDSGPDPMIRAFIERGFDAQKIAPQPFGGLGRTSEPPAYAPAPALKTLADVTDDGGSAADGGMAPPSIAPSIMSAPAPAIAPSLNLAPSMASSAAAPAIAPSLISSTTRIPPLSGGDAMALVQGVGEAKANSDSGGIIGLMKLGGPARGSVGSMHSHAYHPYAKPTNSHNSSYRGFGGPGPGHGGGLNANALNSAVPFAPTNLVDSARGPQFHDILTTSSPDTARHGLVSGGGLWPDGGLRGVAAA